MRERGRKRERERDLDYIFLLRENMKRTRSCAIIGSAINFWRGNFSAKRTVILYFPQQYFSRIPYGLIQTVLNYTLAHFQLGLQ